MKRVQHLWIGLSLCSIALISCIIVIFNCDPSTHTIQPNRFVDWSSDHSLPFKTSFKRSCDISRSATRGRWIEKPSLTRYERMERKRLDKLIRSNMNWPIDLYRNDSRCGKQFPVPGYNIQGQCDPESEAPCCNQETGWCGNDTTHCSCATCTDLRTLISAELYEWHPEPPCTLPRLTSHQACNFLNKHVGSLTFMGDSLIRHVHTAMLLHLSDDIHKGAIPFDATEETVEKCRGEFQIVDKDCSVEKMAHSSDQLESFCEGKANFVVDIIEDYHRTLIEPVRSRLSALLGKQNTWIILGVGLHYQLEFDNFRENYLDRVFEILRQSSNGWPRPIWIGIHGVFGFLRMNIGATNERIAAFNSLASDYLWQRNVTVIETFELSRGVKSYDGRHYGVAFNMLKVQLLLKAIQQHYEG